MNKGNICSLWSVNHKTEIWIPQDLSSLEWFHHSDIGLVTSSGSSTSWKQGTSCWDHSRETFRGFFVFFFHWPYAGTYTDPMGLVLGISIHRLKGMGISLFYFYFFIGLYLQDLMKYISAVVDRSYTYVTTSLLQMKKWNIFCTTSG